MTEAVAHADVEVIGEEIWETLSLLAQRRLEEPVVEDEKPLNVMADEATEAFNTTFLQGGQAVDLQQLLAANSVLPGNYRVDLFSNEVLVGRRDIDFLRNPQNGQVEACLTLDLLKQLGIDLHRLQAEGKLDPQQPQDCYALTDMIEDASVRYDGKALVVKKR